jgi:hypothetical protein
MKQEVWLQISSANPANLSNRMAVDKSISTYLS